MLYRKKLNLSFFSHLVSVLLFLIGHLLLKLLTDLLASCNLKIDRNFANKRPFPWPPTHKLFGLSRGEKCVTSRAKECLLKRLPFSLLVTIFIYVSPGVPLSSTLHNVLTGLVS